MLPGESSTNFIMFETQRLYIREFNIDDAEAVFEYAGNHQNTLFMNWGPESFDETTKYIQSRLAHQIQSPRLAFDFAVCLKDSDALIGSIGLFMDSKSNQAMLGYILNRHFWGCGYASEAAAGMLQFGFLSLDLHRIWAYCDSENTASENVMKRIGLRKEGESKSASYIRFSGREQWRSIKYYALLQREYLNRLSEAGLL